MSIFKWFLSEEKKGGEDPYLFLPTILKFFVEDDIKLTFVEEYSIIHVHNYRGRLLYSFSYIEATEIQRYFHKYNRFHPYLLEAEYIRLEYLMQ